MAEWWPVTLARAAEWLSGCGSPICQSGWGAKCLGSKFPPLRGQSKFRAPSVRVKLVCERPRRILYRTSQTRWHTEPVTFECCARIGDGGLQLRAFDRLTNVRYVDDLFFSSTSWGGCVHMMDTLHEKLDFVGNRWAALCKFRFRVTWFRNVSNAGTSCSQDSSCLGDFHDLRATLTNKHVA